MAATISALREQLEVQRTSLRAADASIRRLGGNGGGDAPFAPIRRGGRGGEFPVSKSNTRIGGERVALKRELGNEHRYDAAHAKRLPAYMRASYSLDEEAAADSGDEEHSLKPLVRSSVVISSSTAPIPIKSKEELIKIQNNFTGSKERNKRIMGVILGTLRHFKKEDHEQSSTTQALHRKELEKKIEVKKSEEKKRIIEEKKRLEQEKYRSAKMVQLLEQKIQLTQHYESWKASQLRYKNFIKTKTGEPSLYYLPKHMTPAVQQLLDEHKTRTDDEIEKRFKEVEAELDVLNMEMDSLNEPDGLIPAATDPVTTSSTAASTATPSADVSSNKENKKDPSSSFEDAELDEDAAASNINVGIEDEDYEDESPTMAAAAGIGSSQVANILKVDAVATTKPASKVGQAVSEDEDYEQELPSSFEPPTQPTPKEAAVVVVAITPVSSEASEPKVDDAGQTEANQTAQVLKVEPQRSQ